MIILEGYPPQDTKQTIEVDLVYLTEKLDNNLNFKWRLLNHLLDDINDNNPFDMRKSTDRKTLEDLITKYNDSNDSNG